MKKARHFLRIGFLSCLLACSGWLVAKGGSRLVQSWRHPHVTLPTPSTPRPSPSGPSLGRAELLDSAQHLFLIPETTAQQCSNLVLYRMHPAWEDDQAVRVFQEPLGIQRYAVEDATLYVVATDQDSNQDGRLNATDLQQLFVHSLDRTHRYTLRLPGHSCLQYQRTPDPDVLLVKFGEDANGNGTYEAHEPQTWQRYTFSTRKLRPVVGSWWLVAGGWWLVAGGWWLVAGGWWLVAGGWWLVAGGWWLVAGG
ncbi:hypothetical protein SAMN05421823_1131, partial [Catalinimonas alkaloidigena]